MRLRAQVKGRHEVLLHEAVHAGRGFCKDGLLAVVDVSVGPDAGKLCPEYIESHVQVASIQPLLNNSYLSQSEPYGRKLWRQDGSVQSTSTLTIASYC
jgi:hypothetical protein